MRIRFADGSSGRPEDIIEEIMWKYQDGEITRDAAIALVRFNLPGIDAIPEVWRHILESLDLWEDFRKGVSQDIRETLS